MRRRNRQAGFTTLEVVVSLAILVLVAVMTYAGLETLKGQARKAKCMGNMRMIHSGLNSHVLDLNHWPQMPEAALEFEEEAYFEWWTKVLEPYGVGKDVWLCPSDKIVKDGKTKPEDYAGSYIPTPFDADQYTPFRWNQPWLMERGNFHGKGAHIIMPDGSISTSMAPRVGGQ